MAIEVFARPAVDAGGVVGIQAVFHGLEMLLAVVFDQLDRVIQLAIDHAGESQAGDDLAVLRLQFQFESLLKILARVGQFVLPQHHLAPTGISFGQLRVELNGHLVELECLLLLCRLGILVLLIDRRLQSLLSLEDVLETGRPLSHLQQRIGGVIFLVRIL